MFLFPVKNLARKGLMSGMYFNHDFSNSPIFSQVIILDVRVPCTPVARLNNHRACVNGIAWAPHSSCHICTAGELQFIFDC